jgi:hypothetical protein
MVTRPFSNHVMPITKERLLPGERCGDAVQ